MAKTKEVGEQREASTHTEMSVLSI